MEIEGTVRRLGRLLTLFVMLAGGSAASGGAYAADWLTSSEREFFHALGVDYRLDGQETRRNATVAELPAIAARAPQPLQARIKTISDAFGRMEVTAEEKKQFQDAMARGQKAVQKEMIGVLFGALAGEDSFDTAVRATNGVVKDGAVQDAWDLQTKWILRGLAARAVADGEMTKITTTLEQRIGRPLSSNDLPLMLVAEQNQLSLSAKAGRTLGSPIVQVILYRKSTGGSWTALNAGSGKLLEMIGVDGMSGSTQGKGISLSVAQEMAMNLPLRTTVLLPDVSAGQRVTVNLDVPVELALQLDRAEVQIWSDVGSIKFDRVDGLDLVQKAATKRIEERRAQAAAARSAPQFGVGAGSRPAAPLFGAPNNGLANKGSNNGSINGLNNARRGGADGMAGAASGTGGLARSGGFGGGGGFGNAAQPVEPEQPARPLTPEERKARIQQETIRNGQALQLLRSAEAAMKRKQLDLARNYCNQILALAPESPSAKSAKQMLGRLDK